MKPEDEYWQGHSFSPGFNPRPEMFVGGYFTVKVRKREENGQIGWEEKTLWFDRKFLVRALYGFLCYFYPLHEDKVEEVIKEAFAMYRNRDKGT